MSMQRLTFPVVIALIAAFAPVAQASLNTTQIVASSLSPACIQWRVSGICYWLFCSWHGCTVKTSVKVTHYLPEAVVSTYHAPGGNPWSEMAQVSQLSGGLENTVTGALSHLTADGGNHNSQISGQRRTSLRFKYADAIGHPATNLIGGQIPGYSCRSAATPLMPYFLSTLDTMVWRTGLPERSIRKPLFPVSGNWAAGWPAICGVIFIRTQGLSIRPTTTRLRLWSHSGSRISSPGSGNPMFIRH
ncbi:integrating conjugative element protein [Xenorhabdus miraniensis]|uniref:Integrating conjugative element protein n=1 Tax=Xenorhabdus miraniensis TaxID=351674 RepID=A0A2D0JMU9_9GAMM|nr:integrating conjugative element protein [Xenorhabdus miraniensis]